MGRYRQSMSEALKTVAENTATAAQVQNLKKAYADMKGKRISFDNAKKLQQIFNRFDSNKELLQQLYKADIPFVSSMASARLISKHAQTAQMLMQLRKEGIEIAVNELKQINDGPWPLDEGRMKDIYQMQKDGATAKQIAKKMKLDINVVKSILGEEVQLDENANVMKGVDEYIKIGTEKIKNHPTFAKLFADQKNELKMSVGPKYIKIHQYERGQKRSIHAFVDKQTGDLYKPASVNAPAKGARGNVTNPKFMAQLKQRFDVHGGHLYARDPMARIFGQTEVEGEVELTEGATAVNIMLQEDEKGASTAKVPAIDKDNKPGVKIAKIRLKRDKMDGNGTKTEDPEKVKDKLDAEIDKNAVLKQKMETEKQKSVEKATKKLINPETGEPLLQIGIAYKHLKDKMKKAGVKKDVGDTESDEVKEETLVEFTQKQIKMAFGILNDPRYKGGNYSGAYKAIEKIARGLANHPSVANALKRANESVEISEGAKIAQLVGKSIAHLGFYEEMIDAVLKLPEKGYERQLSMLKMKARHGKSSVTPLIKELKKPGIFSEEITEGTMTGGLIKYSGQPSSEYNKAVADYKKFMSKSQHSKGAGEKVLGFLFDDSLLDDLYTAQKKNLGDVRPMVVKRMKELGLKEDTDIHFGISGIETERPTELQEKFTVQITKTDGGKLVHGSYKTEKEAEKFIKWYKTGNLSKMKAIKIIPESVDPEAVQEGYQGTILAYLKKYTDKAYFKYHKLLVKKGTEGMVKTALNRGVDDRASLIYQYDLPQIVAEDKEGSAYAIGMAKAKDMYNDEPPLEKKTIRKAHHIADKILNNQVQNGDGMEDQPETPKKKLKIGIVHPAKETLDKLWHKRGDKK